MRLAGRFGDLVDRALERLRIGLRGLGEAAHLAHELERGGPDLLFRRGRFEIEQRADVAAHADLLIKTAFREMHHSGSVWPPSAPGIAGKPAHGASSKRAVTVTVSLSSPASTGVGAAPWAKAREAKAIGRLWAALLGERHEAPEPRAAGARVDLGLAPCVGDRERARLVEERAQVVVAEAHAIGRVRPGRHGLVEEAPRRGRSRSVTVTLLLTL